MIRRESECQPVAVPADCGPPEAPPHARHVTRGGVAGVVAEVAAGVVAVRSRVGAASPACDDGRAVEVSPDGPQAPSCACPRPRPTSARGSTAWRRRSRCTSSSRCSETGTFAVETDLTVAHGRENLCVRAFERLHPADGFTFTISLGDPAGRRPGLERRGDRRGADGRRPPVRAGRRPARAGQRAGGSSRQRRRRAARRLRHLRRRAGDALRAADRPGGDARWCPSRRCAPSAARAALPRAGAARATRSSTSRTARC